MDICLLHRSKFSTIGSLYSGNAQNETAWDDGSRAGKAEYSRSRLWATGRIWGLRGQAGKRRSLNNLSTLNWHSASTSSPCFHGHEQHILKSKSNDSLSSSLCQSYVPRYLLLVMFSVYINLTLEQISA